MTQNRSAPDFSAWCPLPAHPRGGSGRASRRIISYLELLSAQLKSSGSSCGRANLLLACSGGTDSLALAVLLGSLAPQRGFTLYAACVDHGWDEHSSQRAEEVCAFLRTQLGFEQARVLKLPPPQACGGWEGWAREQRYRVLFAYRQELEEESVNPTFLLTAHTRDDQAESVLLGLARGAGSGSLKGIGDGLREGDVEKTRFTSPLRPLLEVPRAYLSEVCAQTKLRPYADPTNYPNAEFRAQDGADLRRAAVRARALPALAEALRIDPRVALAKTARQLREDDAALQAWAQNAYTRARLNRPQGDGETARSECCQMPGAKNETAEAKGGFLLDTESILTLPVAVRLRVWRLAALAAGARAGDLKSTQLRGLDQLFSERRSCGPVDLPGKIKVYRLPGGFLTRWGA